MTKRHRLDRDLKALRKLVAQARRKALRIRQRIAQTREATEPQAPQPRQHEPVS